MDRAGPPGVGLKGMEPFGRGAGGAGEVSMDIESGPKGGGVGIRGRNGRLGGRAVLGGTLRKVSLG